MVVKMDAKSQRQLDAIANDFAQAEAQLVALVNSTLAMTDLSTLRARRQASREAKKLLDRLRRLTPPKAAALVRSSYLAGRKASKVESKPLSEVDRNALQILIENLDSRLGDGIGTVGRRVNDVFRRESLRAASLAISSSGVVDEAAVKKFREKLAKDGVTSFTDSRGHKWGLETYARMALKTTMMEAANTGAENLIRERDFDLIHIGHNGAFEPDQLCSPHHNKTYSLLGRSSQYPLFTPADKPPYHPNCQHFIELAPDAAAERLASRQRAA
jgi:hypothetical protein